MKTTRGHLRQLTDEQIVQVLNWHRDAMEFRRSHGSLRDLARLFGVSLHAVRGCFEIRIPGSASNRRNQTSHSPGRPGRPRHLNPTQIAFAIAWRNAGLRFRARHGTVASQARALGVGASTIHDCIRRKGRYTQRAVARRASPPTSDDAVRAALLRAWLKSGPKL